MNNKLTLIEFLAKRICESDSHNVAEDFAEELATVIYEEYQDEVDMTDDEWSWLLGKIEEFIDQFLIDDAEKLVKEWAEENEDWIKEREEASRGQY